jgi:hypothetical protein
MIPADDFSISAAQVVDPRSFKEALIKACLHWKFPDEAGWPIRCPLEVGYLVN